MIKQISLTQGQVAIVDGQDFERANQFRWYACKTKKTRETYYAMRKARIGDKEKTQYLHRFLMDAPDDLQIDHRDGNGLNCVRSNMRLCTHAQNNCNRGLDSQNRSGYKGVYWFTLRGKWRAEISVNNKRIHLGLFISKEDAAHAYNEAAKKYYGEFALLNETGG